jgi:hypothetical protein
MTKAFDKKALFAALKPKTERVTIEGFGEVGIAQLTVTEVQALRASINKDDQDNKFPLRLVLTSVVDDDGKRVFDESDLPALEAAGNAPIEKMVAKALEVNGFKKAPEAKN